MKLFEHSSVRYLLVGLSNTAVGFGVIWLTLSGFGFGNIAANVTGYAVGFLWSFALNRTWTFRHQGAVGKGFVRYASVCAMAYVANLSVVVLLGSRMGKPSLIVQLCGVVLYTVLAYSGSRRFAFPSEPRSTAN